MSKTSDGVTVRVRPQRIDGPALGASVGQLNRVGSREVPVRVYEPEHTSPWATLVWAHGGSFMRGSLDWPEAHWVSMRFAEAGLRVVSVDYVLASDEVKAPAPGNDVAAVLREVRAQYEGQVFVGGASAGGHLAVAAALAQAEHAQVSEHVRAADALVLAYPTLHRVQRRDERLSSLTADLPQARKFDAERIAKMYEFYLGSGTGTGTGSGSDGDLSGGDLSEGDWTDAEVVGELPRERLALLPPTVMVNADLDDLRASGEQFADQLKESGVQVVVHTQELTVHGYLNRPEESSDAMADAQATITQIVEDLLQVPRNDVRHDSEANVHAARDLDGEPHAGLEPELTAPVSLTLPNGRLNRAAVGWATQPIVDTSGMARGRGRNKRWEYWNIATPTHIVGLTVSHIDYACVLEVWIYDRATDTALSKSKTVIPPRGTQLSPVLEAGSSRARVKGMSIDIDEVDGGTRLRFEIAGASLDVVAALPPGHERLALVVPWSDTRFQYTVKDLARPVQGVLTVGGSTHTIAEDSWAVLDHGRGRWPYHVRWNWGAGSGRSAGRTIGVQVGAQWTEGTGVSENAFFVDGRMHKIHGQTQWQYDLANWRTPWRVTGGGLDATFTPFTNKRTRTNLLALQNHTDQCFGFWSGTFTTEQQEVIDFSDILGWAEDVHNRW